MSWFYPLKKMYVTLNSKHEEDATKYSCFEQGSLTNGEKLTRQCRRKSLSVMVVFTLSCLSERQGVSAW